MQEHNALDLSVDHYNDDNVFEGSSSSSEEGIESPTSASSFELLELPAPLPALAPIEMAIELCGQGIESIVKVILGYHGVIIGL